MLLIDVAAHAVQSARSITSAAFQEMPEQLMRLRHIGDVGSCADHGERTRSGSKFRILRSIQKTIDWAF